MTINDFIDMYVSMILRPAINGRGYTGFVLSNNTKIFFKNSYIHANNKNKLAQHYRNIGAF